MLTRKTRSVPADGVTVRYAVAEDLPDLERLAALDSARVPRGQVLLGLVDGLPVAAASVDHPDVVADPFSYTQNVVLVLFDRARKVRRAHMRPHRSRRPLSRLRAAWF